MDDRCPLLVEMPAGNLSRGMRQPNSAGSQRVSGIGGDRPITVHDPADPVGRHTDVARETVDAQLPARHSLDRRKRIDVPRVRNPSAREARRNGSGDRTIPPQTQIT
jgi:hypothetical protein